MDKDETVTNYDDWEKIYDDLQKKYPQTSGWICPKCGAVNAPWVSQCSCRNNYYGPSVPYPRNPWIEPYYKWTDTGTEVNSHIVLCTSTSE